MAKVIWSPEAARPAEAEALEAKIAGMAHGAQVKLTLTEGVWLVRALTPGAMCARGGDFSARDSSGAIADMLSEEGLPADVFRR